jgi:thiol-disulfide isomerase/thioredoxin/outer membrane lipoprotein-sorting protein
MKCRRIRTTLTIAVVVSAFIATGAAQSAPPSPDPAELLKLVRHIYSDAKYYHIEADVSSEMRSDRAGNWSNTSQNATIEPGGRYRFEVNGPNITWLQVSDGTTEWIYRPRTQEYVQQNTPPDRNPSGFSKDGWTYEEGQLLDAHSIPSRIAHLLVTIREPKLIGSETLTIGSQNFECFIVRGPGRYQPGWAADTKVETTLWIEKRSNYVRKLVERWSGTIARGNPSLKSSLSTELYPVTKLDLPSSPAALFKFAAPTGATLVAKFSQTPFPQKPPSLVGTMAPDVNFRDSTGRLLSLHSFRGRPTLIEFWATWCAPCVAALPKLDQFYSEAVVKGVNVITIDEDAEPEKPAALLAKYGKPKWLQLHDDDEINRAFPGEGLPQFVLIDANGKIVYTLFGFDEKALRTALSQLGPQFASVAE